MHDEDLQKVLKNSGDFSKKDLSDLLDHNESLRLHLKKHKDSDDRRLQIRHESKLNIEVEVKRKMKREEREFIKRNEAQIRA